MTILSRPKGAFGWFTYTTYWDTILSHTLSPPTPDTGRPDRARIPTGLARRRGGGWGTIARVSDRLARGKKVQYRVILLSSRGRRFTRD